MRIIESAVKAGVSTPKIIGSLFTPVVSGKKLRLIVMEFIDGETLYETKQELTPQDVLFLAKEAAKINKIKINIKPIYDQWSITSFLKEFPKMRKYLEKKDLEKILPLVGEFKELNITSLSYCFVHGDLLKTNVMRDKNKKLWIIDFGVASFYPRIQELSVLACNILFDYKNKKKSEEMFSLALNEYQKHIKLTKKEVLALPFYIKMAHVMHIIGGTREKIKNKNLPEENKYWLEEGQKGLRQS